MKVFYPDRTPITDPEEFVSFYARVYWYANCKGDVEENSIEKILKEGVSSEADVAKLLVWKTGGKVVEGIVCPVQGPRINVKDVFAVVEEFGCNADGRERELAQALKGVDGIGGTYAITVLYFVSGGKYPIYDRFAHAAIVAIREGCEIGTCLDDQIVHEFSDQRVGWFGEYEERFVSVLKGEKEPEGENAELLRYLRDNYAKSRDVDRALWAYGHLFS